MNEKRTKEKKMKRLAFLAFLLCLLAGLAEAQVGSVPGISGGSSGGQSLGASGCTNPPYSFAGRPTVGLCSSAAGNWAVQTASSGNSRSYVGGGTTSGSLAFYDAAGFDAQVRVYNDTIDFAAAGTTMAFMDGTVPEFRVGYTAYDPIALKPVAKGTNQFQGTITSDDLTSARTWTFPDLGGTVLLGGVTNTLTAGTTFTRSASNLTHTMSLAQGAWSVTGIDASGSPTYYTTIKSDPSDNRAAWISMTDLTNSGQVNITAGTAQLQAATTGATTTMIVYPTGVRLPNLYDGGPTGQYTLIKGGFTLDGTLTSTVNTIDVTVVDTTGSINTGYTQVCGYANATDQTNLKITCDDQDWSTMGGGGGTVTKTTVATFIEVLAIKAAGIGVLGGGGDEKISARWTGPGASILAQVNLTNSAISDYVSSPITVSGNYWSPICLDRLGCNVEMTDLAANDSGRPLIVVARDGTYNLIFSDSANMDIAASGAFTATVGDTITFVYARGNAKAWVEVARSNN